jgi:hypothetical protein
MKLLRRTTRAVSLGLLLATVSGSSVGDSNPAHAGILFAVTDPTRGVVVSHPDKPIETLVEPVAVVSNGKLANLPDKSHWGEFTNTYYSNHRQYDLYVGGRPSGTLQIKQPHFDEDACESLAAMGTVSPDGSVTGMRMALASDVKFPDSQYARRKPSADERRQFLNLAARVYAAHHIAPEVAARVTVSNLTVLEGNHHPLLIGSAAATPPREASGDEDVEEFDAVFIIAEPNTAGSYATSYEWFHSSSDIETQDLIDALDIDGSGTPQIVTLFGYPGRVEYHLYKEIGAKWTDIYRQSGRGC